MGLLGGNGQLLTLGIGLLFTALAAAYVTRLAKVTTPYPRPYYVLPSQSNVLKQNMTANCIPCFVSVSVVLACFLP